ncbi:MAG TPA: 5'-nucleotidase C-terminal domain-containing protein, partial [Prolixibacteraceae bacterium]|nr:5'-nucleotidase C-terminal domain-containing protein [Prolixibacteraceae bacterium]
MMREVMNRLLLILLLFLWVSCVPVYEAVSFQGNAISFHTQSDSLQDPEFQKQLNPYRQQMKKELSDTLAFSSVPLVSFRPESPLSNLLSDMIFDWGQKSFRNWVTDSSLSFSVMNHGGIRSALPEGAITVGDLFSLLPFENEMIVLRLNGSQIAELADHL